MGDLKALLKTSQDELKSFNLEAQKGLVTQIKEIMANVDFNPLTTNVSNVNKSITDGVGSLNAAVRTIETTLKGRIQAIEDNASRTNNLGFFSSVTLIAAGMVLSISMGYGFYQYEIIDYEQKLEVQNNEKWKALDARFRLLNTQKFGDWNILKMDDNGREYLQLVNKDARKKVQCGWASSKESDMGFPVSYINIPIYK